MKKYSVLKLVLGLVLAVLPLVQVFPTSGATRLTVIADVDLATMQITLESEDLDGTEKIEACGDDWDPKWVFSDGTWSTSFDVPSCPFTLFWVDQIWVLRSDNLIQNNSWVAVLGLPEPIFTDVIFLPFVGKGGH